MNDKAIKDMAELEVSLAQAAKNAAEAVLAAKKAQWYEIVLACSFTAGLITVGIAISKAFL
ncbi:MAG: hypothetical protein V3T17_16660 [Pseudomonadales bacterium]